ncbi:V-type proton ATPase subunit C 1-B [Gadus chalcogrammus]|uniref:V-type proton ATPase subunit C 1-B n=1 Tax=Gadus chalcogrammus TaxID=1042646 RepID=UPI0024C32512|nr:V-type proton ATPase subunit C 1-B [Gadus chalcogrammus]
MEFWLLSLPLDKTSVASLEKLKRTIAKTNLATCGKLSIPELKVGTLDNLLSVSDNLSQLDTLTESVIKKTCHFMGEVMEQASDKVLEKGLVNGVDLVKYVTKFQWDRAKYPTSLPLRVLADNINKQVSQVDAEFKSRASAYNSIKSSLHCLERKAEGNLHTRGLNDIVTREDLLESEYLTTLLVVVSRGDYKQWDSTYESFSLFVVPRSSRMLYEDTQCGVFSVILFRRAVSDFRERAKQSKFTVRQCNMEVEEKHLQEIQRLNVDNKEQHVVFVRWLKVNFREVFVAWIHLKALRVFVESVLRYGLPVSYQALLLQPDRKRVKRLRQELSSLFMHLEPSAMSNKVDASFDVPEMIQQEYFSYICFQINTNMLDTGK